MEQENICKEKSVTGKELGERGGRVGEMQTKQ